MRSNVKRLVFAAMMAAICCAATIVIQIPMPLSGYINLGDCIVLLCAWLPGGWLGVAAAGIGSALADFITGYTIYVPATFIIKSLMALVAWGIKSALGGKRGSQAKNILTIVLCAVCAEAIMIAGYFLYAAILGGTLAAGIESIPGNSVQAVAGIVIGSVAVLMVEKLKLPSSMQ